MTWIDAYQGMQTMARRENGATPAGQPRVTNEQAASILRYTIRTVQQFMLPETLVAKWYLLSLGLAGWTQPGDKFKVDAAHRKAMFPDALTPVLWQTALGVVNANQSANRPFVTPTISPAADYDLILRKAWAKMQADGADGPRADGDALPATVPDAAVDAAKPPKSPPASGSNAGLLTLVVLYLISEGI